LISFFASFLEKFGVSTRGGVRRQKTIEKRGGENKMKKEEEEEEEAVEGKLTMQQTAEFGSVRCT